jgi:Zn-dependent protease with chaperone function
MSLVYAKEPSLFRICAVISLLCWLALVVGTLGVALLFVAASLFVALFAQAAFVSYLRGMGVRVTATQLPDIHEQLRHCCRTLDVQPEPECYVIQANGVLNALAARFLRQSYVVLYGDVLDALASRPRAVSFYLGHELGHIKRGHLAWAGFLMPAKVLPLIGAAYARAREHSCDLHGLACCKDPRDAAFGLAVLAAGAHAAQSVDLRRLAEQSELCGGFWMSFNELTSDYPWLTKRMKRLMRVSGAEEPEFPQRSVLAWLLAALVPNFGLGAASAVPGLAMIPLIGVLAAIAIPNFVRFQERSKAAQIGSLRADVQERASRYIEEHGELPPSLVELGLPEDHGASLGTAIRVTENGFAFVPPAALQGSLGESFSLEPWMEAGALHWTCGESIPTPALREVVCESHGAAAPPPMAPPGEDPAPEAEPEETSLEPSREPVPLANAGNVLQAHWRPTSAETEFPALAFGAGGSVVVTLPDGRKLLGTYRQDADRVTVQYSADAEPVIAEYQLSRSGATVLLRPVAGGPFYARQP